MSLPKEKLLRAYRQMKTIREFEERTHAEIMNGQIAGFTPLYTGQEANAVPMASWPVARPSLSARHWRRRYVKTTASRFPFPVTAPSTREPALKR